MKRILIIILAALLSLGWIFAVKGEIGSEVSYSKTIKQAQESVSDELYEQGVELYNKALEMKPGNNKLYVDIKEAYKLYDKEQGSTDSRKKYINSLIKCTEIFPKSKEYWVEIIKIYMDDEDYRNANTYIKKALNFEIKDDYIDASKKKIDYIYTERATGFEEYLYKPKTNSGSFGEIYIVKDENGYKMLSNSGDDASDIYTYIGIPNDKGEALYIDKSGMTVKDSKFITRHKLTGTVDKAGEISENLIPVCSGDSWYYIDLTGKKVLGDYEYATSFVNKMAAVKESGSWFIINQKGQKQDGLVFSDIKLSLSNSYVHNGELILAKKDKKYSIYNTEFKKVGDFSCADIDIYTGEPIAFSNGTNWGFVNEKGKVVLEPKFTSAKSFSNGYAAFLDNSGLWGFCNKNFDTAISGAFASGGYFDSNERCVVEFVEDTLMTIEFKYR